jgi:diadenosine tetraphosphate (Ap4A) HIT family hydrolase
MAECLFCKIAKKEKKSFTVMEDKNHVAFLDIFPNTKGQTVVITKKHFGSYPFDMCEEDYIKLFSFARNVAKKLDRSLGAIRTFLVVEGMEVDHVHIKLYPIYKIKSKVRRKTKFYESYQGFLTTLHGQKADEKTLEELVMKIQNTR